MIREVEAPHWMTIAHLDRWRTEQKNRLIIKILLEKKISLEAFFALPQTDWEKEFGLSRKESESLAQAKADIPNYSFCAEDLLAQGFELIPINSNDFSKTLKHNLKTKYTPPLIYTKGNKELLAKTTLAIVGSRRASQTALEFTDRIAQKAVTEDKVIVSGFAKGIDRQALNRTLKYKGQSIIVLPQGITTFKSGFRKYYREIVQGNLLVLSTFHPQAKWAVGLAMARNAIIYGLANEIYVAESDLKGGTWQGAQDGLKKGRSIYVRNPLPGEENGNLALIQAGAVGVDLRDDKIITHVYPEPETPSNPTQPKYVREEMSFDNNILYNLLRDKPLSSKQVIEHLKINYPSRKMTNHLKSLPKIKTLKGRPLKFVRE